VIDSPGLGIFISTIDMKESFKCVS